MPRVISRLTASKERTIKAATLNCVYLLQLRSLIFLCLRNCFRVLSSSRILYVQTASAIENPSGSRAIAVRAICNAFFEDDAEARPARLGHVVRVHTRREIRVASNKAPYVQAARSVIALIKYESAVTPPRAGPPNEASNYATASSRLEASAKTAPQHPAAASRSVTLSE